MHTSTLDRFLSLYLTHTLSLGLFLSRKNSILVSSYLTQKLSLGLFLSLLVSSLI